MSLQPKQILRVALTILVVLLVAFISVYIVEYTPTIAACSITLLFVYSFGDVLLGLDMR